MATSRTAIRRTRAVLALAVAAAVAGCGSLNTGKAESEIAKAIQSQVGVTVASVDCPKDVKPKAGAVFTCTATGKDGTAAEITVTQKDDKGNVHISAPLVHVPTLEKNLAAKIGGSAALDCPDLITVKQGASFTCDAKSSTGNTTKVKVTFTDDQGNLQFEVQNHG